MRTDALIVQLARAADPVTPLRRPLVRLGRWMALVAPVTIIAVLALHPREDLAAALLDDVYLARAATTLATAVVAAAMALVLSVPGAERSPYQRAFPLVCGGLWIVVLVAVLTSGGDAAARLAAFPINPLCLYEIAGLSAVPALSLVAMLRRAAPLRPGWNAVLAGLAAAALAAAGTQLLCPVDDAAHQLVGHVVPVVGLTLAMAAAARPWLNVWF